MKVLVRRLASDRGGAWKRRCESAGLPVDGVFVGHCSKWEDGRGLSVEIGPDYSYDGLTSYFTLVTRSDKSLEDFL